MPLEVNVSLNRIDSLNIIKFVVYVLVDQIIPEKTTVQHDVEATDTERCIIDVPLIEHDFIENGLCGSIFDSDAERGDELFAVGKIGIESNRRSINLIVSHYFQASLNRRGTYSQSFAHFLDTGRPFHGDNIQDAPVDLIQYKSLFPDGRIE